MKIAVVVREGISCDYHRLINPLAYMNIGVTSVTDADTIIFNRKMNYSILDLKAQGKKVIMDIDDYWHLYPSHYLYNSWDAGVYVNNLKEADIVTCTNEFLADRIREYNKNVVIIPNALPFDKGQFVDNRETIEGVFGYVGGASHSCDIKLCPDAVIPPHISVDRYMDYYRYLALSYAPLVNNEFNRCKSNLKALESGVNYTALMASDIHPYYNELDKDVVIYCKDNEWDEKIDYCKRNPEYVKEMGLKLGEHVREHYDLIKINELRREVWFD